MNLLNLKEYLLKYPNKNLADYQEYLKMLYLKIEKLLKKAQELNLSKSSLKEIQKKQNKIIQIFAELYQNSEAILDQTLNEFSLEELQSYFKDSPEKQIKKTTNEYDLMCLKAKLNAQKRFLQDKLAMKSILKNLFLKKTTSNPFAYQKIEELESDQLKRDYFSLFIRIQNLEKMEEILFNRKNLELLQYISKENTTHLSQLLKISPSEDSLIKEIEKEKKRFEQINLMIATENILNKIYTEIKDIKKKVLKKAKDLEKIKLLNQKYQMMVQKSLTRFQNRNLMKDSTQNFLDLKDLITDFCPLNFKLEKNTQEKLRAKEYPTWLEYTNELKKQQRKLTKKLFHISKTKDGYYQFEISENEKEELITIELQILSILDYTYYEKKQKNYENETFKNNEKIDFLKSILDKENVSLENIALFIEQTQTEIKELLENSYLCQHLNIQNPKVNFNETLSILKKRFSNYSTEENELETSSTLKH